MQPIWIGPGSREDAGFSRAWKVGPWSALQGRPKDAVPHLDGVDHLEAPDDPAEHRVQAVEVGRGKVRDEDLASARVEARRARHPHRPPPEGDLVDLGADAPPRVAPPVPERVAPLDDEVGHDAVPLEAVVESALDETHEI